MVFESQLSHKIVDLLFTVTLLYSNRRLSVYYECAVRSVDDFVGGSTF